MSKEYTQALDDLFGLVAFQKSLTREQFERVQKYNDIIEQALQRLEAIDNANSSEALKRLAEWYGFLMADNDTIYSNGNENEIEYNRRKETIYNQYGTIKQALIEAQENENKIDNLEYENKRLVNELVEYTRIIEEQHKVLNIIKEKCVDVGYVITLFMYKDYNSKMDELWGEKASSYYLTEEEFKLLKGWLSDEIH